MFTGEKMQKILILMYALICGLLPLGASARNALLFTNPTSGAAQAQKIKVCPDGQVCTVIVKVTQDPHDQKRCLIEAETPIVMVRRNAGAPIARDITWEITPPGNDYRFDPKTGIDVAGDNDPSPSLREFDNGKDDASSATKKYTVKHRRHVGNRELAYSYSINVQRQHMLTGGASLWAHCGVQDPMIINRD
jgi:hypothetical protein